MRRVLCVWLVRWPIQRLLAERPALRGRPLVLYERYGQGSTRVVSCSREAAEIGIAAGESLAEAISGSDREAQYVLEPFDSSADRQALVGLAGWCEQFCPTVGLEESDAPESLLLDVSGCERLFGGESGLACRVAGAFAQRGFVVRVALADTIGAAWAVAREGADRADVADCPAAYGRGAATMPAAQGPISMVSPGVVVVPRGRAVQAIGPLSVRALRLPLLTVQRLMELGIGRIAQLLLLNRSSLASRFGSVLIDRLDQAAGRLEEAIVPHRFVPPAHAVWAFEPPIEHQGPLEAVLDRLLEQLAAQLPSGQGILRLVGRLDRPQQDPATFEAALFQPSMSLRHLSELVRLQLDRLGETGPIGQIDLWAAATDRVECRQRVFFEDTDERIADAEGELARLVDRLSSRLGRQAVLRVVLVPDAQPEFARRFEPWTSSARPGVRVRHSQQTVDGQGRGATSPSPPARPIRLLPTPMPVQTVSVAPDGPPIRFCAAGAEHLVRQTWGPERIETGWWRRDAARRDYYQVETMSGQRCWLFRRRSDRRWFLHGWFA